MSHPSDQVAQQSFLGIDDRAFQDQRKRKVQRPKPEPPAVPDEPCCNCCANWERPGSTDEFGRCGVLAVVSDIGHSRFERGTIGIPEEFTRAGVGDWQSLPTRAGFLACSLFWQVA